MKAFDPNSIKDRMVQKLSEYGNWTRIARDSSIDVLLSSFSEALAEISRYNEYLFRENTWDAAQNISSILNQVKFFGYTPKRKKSAIGNIVIASDSGLENITSTDALETLTSYAGSNVVISARTPFSIEGKDFFSSESITFSNTQKYVIVPVIQGVLKTEESAPVTGVAFEKIEFKINNIEAAANSETFKFFTVSFESGGTTTVCTQTESLFLEGNDYFYELENIFSDNGLDDRIIIKFGNNISGKILPKDAVVKLSYIATQGEDGNVDTAYNSFKSISVDGTTFYFQNVYPLLGGEGREDLATIKATAPTSYLSQGSVVTADQYKAVLESITSIQKATVFGDTGTNRIKYSAINDLNLAPDEADLSTTFLSLLIGKKAPLDILEYIETDFIDVSLETKITFTGDNSANPLSIESDIITEAYTMFGLSNTQYVESFKPPEWITLVAQYFKNNNISANQTTYTRAKIILKPSSFSIDNQAFYASKMFSLNEAFVGIDTNKPYLYQINIIKTGPNCESKQRTLFVILENGVATLKQFPLTTDLIYNEGDWSVFLTNNGDKEFSSGDAEYFDFKFQLNGSSELGESTLEIPFSYYDFSSSEADDWVQITIFAFSIYSVSEALTPVSKNSIIRILESDIHVEV